MSDYPLISIIDDDEGVRLSLDGLIRSLGYRVALFESAEDFLASGESGRSRCIISDVQMPGGLTGVEMAQRLRALGTKTPVILISSFPNDDAQMQAEACGAFCTVKKPFDGDRLIDCLERAVEGSN